MYFILFIKLAKLDNKATGWLYAIIHHYIALLIVTCYEYFNCFMVILRNTTGPYGRPMLEVAYGEMPCSLHRGCMGVDSSRRVVGMSTCCRPCWTYPGQHQCGLTVFCFRVFILYQYNIYIYKGFSNLYTVQKKHWWSLSLSWPDEVQRIVFDRPFDFI